MASTFTHAASGTFVASVAIAATGASPNVVSCAIALVAAYATTRADLVVFLDTPFHKLVEGVRRYLAKDPAWHTSFNWDRYTKLHTKGEGGLGDAIHRLIDGLGFHSNPGESWYKRLGWLDILLLLVFAGGTAAAFRYMVQPFF